MTTTIISELSDEQQAAVDSDEAEILVAAAAGSGKTRMMTERVKRLVRDGVAPNRIACITYTCAGAKVMQERLPGLRLAYVGTIHSLMLRLIQKHGWRLGLPDTISVLDEESEVELLERCRAMLKVKATADELKEAVTKLSIHAPMTPHPSKVELVAVEFHQQQRITGELTFDNLLQYGLLLIQKSPEIIEFDHVLCDESQDQNGIDWNIIDAMPCENKMWTGDDRQAIYSFRGSEPERFVKRSFAAGVAVFNLTTNYRSSVAVIQAAERLIVNNTDGIPMTVRPRPDAPTGTVLVTAYENPGSELANIHQWLTNLPAGVTATCLWRTNALANACKDYLLSLGVKLATPRQTAKDSPASRLGRACLAFMHDPWSDSAALRLIEATNGKESALLARQEADQALTGVAGRVNGGLIEFGGKDAVFEGPDFAGAVEDSPLPSSVKPWLVDLSKTVPSPFTISDLILAAARPDEEQPAGDSVVISTAHSAKGQEYDFCWIGGVEAELWPGRDTEQESRRLLYVACTRARTGLVLSWCRTRPATWAKWKIEQRRKSIFLDELMP